MSTASKIVAWSRGGGRFVAVFPKSCLYSFFGFDLPPTVEVGENVEFLHNAIGTVIHPSTVIGDGAIICQNVTIGDGTIGQPTRGRRFEKVVIGPKAVIGAGAKILGSNGTLVIGKGCIVGANAVLTKSTGDNEIWVGVPARLIRKTAGAVSHRRDASDCGQSNDIGKGRTA